MDGMNQGILDLLSSLPGVIDVAALARNDVPLIRQREESNQERQFIPLRNAGILEVLKRDSLCVILKDASFRLPPCPTIYMVEEAENEEPPEDKRLEIAGCRFYIVGEEVLDKKREYAEEHVFFQRDFVLFPGRRKRRHHIPALLMIPPIPFPELEEKKQQFAIDNIMSVSPSTQSDDYLRTAYRMPNLPEYATILIGWDNAEL